MAVGVRKSRHVRLFAVLGLLLMGCAFAYTAVRLWRIQRERLLRTQVRPLAAPVAVPPGIAGDQGVGVAGSRSAAYVTWVSADAYVDSALVLALSLARSGTRFGPLLVAGCPSLLSRDSVNRLQRCGNVVWVPCRSCGDIRVPAAGRPLQSSWYTAVHKLSLFGAPCLDGVKSSLMWLDADSVFIHSGVARGARHFDAWLSEHHDGASNNVDHIWALPDATQCAQRQAPGMVAPGSAVTSALLVSQPSPQRYADLRAWVSTQPAGLWTHGDQAVIQAWAEARSTLRRLPFGQLANAAVLLHPRQCGCLHRMHGEGRSMWTHLSHAYMKAWLDGFRAGAPPAGSDAWLPCEHHLHREWLALATEALAG